MTEWPRSQAETISIVPAGLQFVASKDALSTGRGHMEIIFASHFYVWHVRSNVRRPRRLLLRRPLHRPSIVRRSPFLDLLNLPPPHPRSLARRSARQETFLLTGALRTPRQSAPCLSTIVFEEGHSYQVHFDFSGGYEIDYLQRLGFRYIVLV
jgi:hypothetical protein